MNKILKESAQILKKLDGSPVTTGVARRIYYNAAYKLRLKMDEFLKTL